MFPILFWGSLSLFCLPVPSSSLDSILISCVCLFKALAVGFVTLLTYACFPLCHLVDHVLQLFGSSSLPSSLWLRYQSLMIRDLPFFGNICQILLYIIWGHIFLGADLGIIIYSWWIKTFININSQCMSLVIFYPQIYWSNVDIHQQRPFMRLCTYIIPHSFLWVSQVVLVVKTLFANAEHTRVMGSIPGWGRSLGRGNGNPHQYSCLKDFMGRGAWWATVHGVTESDTT